MHQAYYKLLRFLDLLAGLGILYTVFLVKKKPGQEADQKPGQNLAKNLVKKPTKNLHKKICKGMPVSSWANTN